MLSTDLSFKAVSDSRFASEGLNLNRNGRILLLATPNMETLY